MPARHPILVVCFSLLLLPHYAHAQWRTSISRDEMTGEKSCHAQSAVTGPTSPMGFPYNDLTAWLGIGHKGTKEWAYIGFTQAPNLADGDVGDGYSDLSNED